MAHQRANGSAEALALYASHAMGNTHSMPTRKSSLLCAMRPIALVLALRLSSCDSPAPARTAPSAMHVTKISRPEEHMWQFLSAGPRGCIYFLKNVRRTYSVPLSARIAALEKFLTESKWDNVHRCYGTGA